MNERGGAREGEGEEESFKRVVGSHEKRTNGGVKFSIEVPLWFNSFKHIASIFSLRRRK